MEDDRVLITYDPTTGKLEFSAPKDQLEQASEQAQVLIKMAHACLLPADRRRPPESTPSATPPASSNVSGSKPRAQSSKKTSESAARTGRIGSFEKVEFGMSEDQERAVHEFYQTRRPSEQAHQAVVAMFIGSKVLGRTAFEYNEIYTLMHLGGERDLPKALDVVMSGLLKKNWVAKEGKGFALKFLARDYVEKLTAEAE
jgi:hypothetical protein